MKVAEVIAILSRLPPDAEMDVTGLFGGGPTRVPQGPRGGMSNAEKQRRKRLRERGLDPDATPSFGVANGVATPNDTDTERCRDTETTPDAGDPPSHSPSGQKTFSDQESPESTEESVSGSGALTRLVSMPNGVANGVATPNDTDTDTGVATPKQSRRRAPNTRIADGFALKVAHREHAASKEWPIWWIENRFEQFCDLARAKGWTYADWDRALYTFLRNEVQLYGRGPEQLAHLAPKTPARQPFLEQNEARSEVRRRELAAELKGPAASTVQVLIAGIGGADG